MNKTASSPPPTSTPTGITSVIINLSFTDETISNKNIKATKNIKL